MENKIKVGFHNFDEINKKDIKFTVTISRYNGKWVYVKHKDRDTWDIPGGHVEKGEDIIQSAKRELFEESGAEKYFIEPVSVYSVDIDNKKSYGWLFYAEIKKFGILPDMEMEAVKFFSSHPSNLTYPEILTLLQFKVDEHLRNRKDESCSDIS